MERADVVIIGGGVVGASVAYHLTERGCRDVLILEREDSLGLGSTGKATGGVRAQFETEINIQLSLYSLDFFDNWEYDCGYEPRGYVFLATNEHHLGFLRESSERQRALGYAGVEIVDPKSIAERVPGLNCDDVIGGSFGPRDGFIDPLAVLKGFMSRAVENGARVRTTANVRSIATTSGRVTGVEIDGEPIECSAAVICAGAWAKPIAASAGIDLPVEPQRRQIVWARTKETLPADMPMVIDLSDGFHFRSAKGSVDEVLFAYPDPDERSGSSTAFEDSFVHKVYSRARHRAPFLGEATLVRDKCRAGLYENSPDHHAILGACDVDGLFLANGFSGHGVMHSPATGRALAEIIIDGNASFLDVSSLAIGRFARGELLHETAFI